MKQINIHIPCVMYRVMLGSYEVLQNVLRLGQQQRFDALMEGLHPNQKAVLIARAEDVLPELRNIKITSSEWANNTA